MSGHYEKPCVTSLFLYRTISLFLTKTYLYSASIIPLSVWITSPNISCFASEFNSIWIHSFYFGNNFYNNLVIIDLGSKDDTLCILKELEKENFNLKILNKEEGKIYLENQLW